MEPPTIPVIITGGQTGTNSTTNAIYTTSCSGINPVDTVQNNMSGGRGGPPRGERDTCYGHYGD
ncbi:hypothetical protein TWF506_011010 [Arthrobotrys conoides]|uniref:Uncharacterized protein n=1 Tax=Arthrobotrys conoides TaxID=74498 RepID=A0AAN8RMW2_9PEZI